MSVKKENGAKTAPPSGSESSTGKTSAEASALSDVEEVKAVGRYARNSRRNDAFFEKNMNKHLGVIAKSGEISRVAHLELADYAYSSGWSKEHLVTLFGDQLSVNTWQHLREAGRVRDLIRENLRESNLTKKQAESIGDIDKLENVVCSYVDTKSIAAKRVSAKADSKQRFGISRMYASGATLDQIKAKYSEAFKTVTKPEDRLKKVLDAFNNFFDVMVDLGESGVPLELNDLIVERIAGSATGPDHMKLAEIVTNKEGSYYQPVFSSSGNQSITNRFAQIMRSCSTFASNKHLGDVVSSNAARAAEREAEEKAKAKKANA